MPEAMGWGYFAPQNNKQWIPLDDPCAFSSAGHWLVLCLSRLKLIPFQFLSISQHHTKMAQVAEAAAAETLCCAVCCAGCTGCCGGDCCRDCLEGCGLLSCCELLGCLACLSCCCPCCCQSQKQGPPPVVLAQGPAMYPPGYTPEQMMMGPPVYAPQAQVMGYPQGAYR